MWYLQCTEGLVKGLLKGKKYIRTNGVDSVSTIVDEEHKYNCCSFFVAEWTMSRVNQPLIYCSSDDDCGSYEE